jgi:cytochrome b
MPHRVRVWDLPTRLFHWLLVISVIGLVITGHVGGNAMDWHARIGYAVFALLLFRIVWGFIGGHWSQFRSFLYGRAASGLPGGRAHPDHLVGHSPLGAGSVFAMLLVLGAQVATGLVGDDEIAFTGPLNRLVSTAAGCGRPGTTRRWASGCWWAWSCCTSPPSSGTCGASGRTWCGR